MGRHGEYKVDAAGARRHDGQLRDHSLLAHVKRFDTSDLHAGSTFTAQVEGLLAAIRKWQQCADTFEDTLSTTSLSSHIKDGSGPVANALGTRFNHRIGTDGGIGYAADAYLSGLQEILAGLIQTTQGYAQSDQTFADTLADPGENA
ncbi:MAG TPA: hypothetical protein VHV74_17555 [Pseudonocardiaceae bacterium]|nr:hypothetical protein [Pseudonocardiaceae bacterium]